MICDSGTGFPLKSGSNNNLQTGVTTPATSNRE
jgi:hypothetical protein